MEKKTVLVQDLAAHTEGLRAKLTNELERYKRTLDEDFRRKAGVYDKQLAYYVTFSSEYSGIIAELYALDGEWVETLNKMHSGLGGAMRTVFLSKAHRRLMEAQEKLNPLDPYMDTINVKLRVAHLFNDLSAFIAEGANDGAHLRELALETGYISAGLQLELLGPYQADSTANVDAP